MTAKKDTAKKATRGKAQAGDVEETGEVCDIAGAQERCADAARLVKEFCDHDAIPDFLLCAVLTALNLARNKTEVNFWQVKPGNTGEDFDLKGLEALLAVSQGIQQELELEPKKDLAELISAVLTHPDTPPRIYNALSEEVSGLMDNETIDSPDVIRMLLLARPRAGKGGVR